MGVALLTQSIVAGIGNVFKSEVCFACRVNPFRRVASLSGEELDGLMKPMPIAEAQLMVEMSSVEEELHPWVVAEEEQFSHFLQEDKGEVIAGHVIDCLSH